MIVGWIHALAACAAMTGAGGSQPREEARIKILNTTPDRILSILGGSQKNLIALSAPLPTMRSDLKSNALIVSGTPEEIKDLREIIRLLDITPKRLRVSIRLYRVRQVNGRDVDELVAENVSVTANNAPAAIGVGDESWDQTISVTPRLNGEGSVTLRFDFAFAVGTEVKQRLEPFVRRVGSGKIVSITYSDMPEGATYATADDGVAKSIRIAGGRPKYRIEAGAMEVLPDLPRKK